MKFRPCIDLHNGKVKQIVGATLRDAGSAPVTNFETDLSSAHFAQMYRLDNLMGGHVIMLGSGNVDAAVNALSAWPGGLQIGGGITAHNAPFWIKAGASQVIVTSYVFSQGAIDWDHIRELVDAVGKEHIVFDLSCKFHDGNFFIVTDRWQNFTDVTISTRSCTELSEYCCEFLVHAADVEGKQQGIDDALVKLLAKVAPIPVTYAGGIRSLADIDTINTFGNGRIDFTVGSALDIFGGKLTYADVVAHCRNA